MDDYNVINEGKSPSLDLSSTPVITLGRSEFGYCQVCRASRQAAKSGLQAVYDGKGTDFTLN
jgi:hypothetical protein